MANLIYKSASNGYYIAWPGRSINDRGWAPTQEEAEAKIEDRRQQLREQLAKLHAEYITLT